MNYILGMPTNQIADFVAFYKHKNGGDFPKDLFDVKSCWSRYSPQTPKQAVEVASSVVAMPPLTHSELEIVRGWICKIAAPFSSFNFWKEKT